MKRVTPAIPSMGGFFVDDSGGWGSGGIFSALKAKSKKPSRYYETAYDMKGLLYQLLQFFSSLYILKQNMFHCNDVRC